jgi:hypothetical protein
MLEYERPAILASYDVAAVMAEAADCLRYEGTRPGWPTDPRRSDQVRRPQAEALSTQAADAGGKASWSGGEETPFT